MRTDEQYGYIINITFIYECMECYWYVLGNCSSYLRDTFVYIICWWFCYRACMLMTITLVCVCGIHKIYEHSATNYCPLMNKQFLGNQNGKRYTFKFLSESNNTFWLLYTHQFSLSWYTVNFTVWSDFAQSILLIIGIKSVTVVIGP